MSAIVLRTRWASNNKKSFKHIKQRDQRLSDNQDKNFRAKYYIRNALNYGSKYSDLFVGKHIFLLFLLAEKLGKPYLIIFVPLKLANHIAQFMSRHMSCNSIEWSKLKALNNKTYYHFITNSSRVFAKILVWYWLQVLLDKRLCCISNQAW